MDLAVVGETYVRASNKTRERYQFEQDFEAADGTERYSLQYAKYASDAGHK